MGGGLVRMQKWIIPCKLKYFNAIEAFKRFPSIDWVQNVNIEVGDLVYIYITMPLGAIKFLTKVSLVNQSTRGISTSEFSLDPEKYENHGRYMRLELIQTYDDQLFNYQLLKEHGLKSIQGQNRVSSELAEFLFRQADNSGKRDRNSLENIEERDLIETINHESLNLHEKFEEYNPVPKQRLDFKRVEGINIYPRNRKTAINALFRAGFLCEYDNRHPSFLRKKTNIMYVEPHHLVPLSCQEEFMHSLDVEANIVSLCSNCHNQIHYGEGREIVELLYLRRNEELERAGITISLSNLLSKY